MAQPAPFPTPKFIETVIQAGRIDGYWVEIFWADPGDRNPGIVGYIHQPNAVVGSDQKIIGLDCR
jgi:hypothetical protein